MNAKIYKILAHKFLNTDISVWLDGNIFLLQPVEEFVEWFLGDADVGVWKHFNRDCIYDEAPAAIGLGGDYVQGINEQVEYYKAQGFPAHAGLAECNVIARRHNKKVEAFNNDWWAEICRFSCRDQIAFPYVLKNHSLRVKFNPGNPREHELFQYIPHI